MWSRKRGIVTSIKTNHCIVLTPDGIYEKIPLPSPGVQIGEEVAYHRALLPSGVKPMLMVASLLIVLMSSVLLYQASVPVAVAYVSLDINPSMEISVDKNSLVIDVNCLNQEAVKLVKQENFKGKNLYDTLSRLIDKAVEQNYIKPGEDNLIISTVSAAGTNTAPVDQQAICQSLERSAASRNCSVQVKMFTTSDKIHKAASNKGISSGKYLIYEQLTKTGTQVSIDDVKKNSIKQLVDEYKMDLLPNQKKFTMDRINRNSKPEINVDDNEKKVPIKDYIKGHKGWSKRFKNQDNQPPPGQRDRSPVLPHRKINRQLLENTQQNQQRE